MILNWYYFFLSLFFTYYWANVSKRRARCDVYSIDLNFTKCSLYNNTLLDSPTHKANMYNFSNIVSLLVPNNALICTKTITLIVIYLLNYENYLLVTVPHSNPFAIKCNNFILALRNLYTVDQDTSFLQTKHYASVTVFVAYILF